ncbi:sigma-70-like protein [Haloactinopolyspora alba]|uniref:Sigma-70-like protein n=1 Tax=Haloactinopolyspora alba TaxID=648780 RepID=A0A2P8DM10_9ACTN|nr:sigma factor [Haloactinopolyspora alba]PSK98227.1 sigma-70-like protein [Haloactinopolyspora alba]
MTHRLDEALADAHHRSRARVLATVVRVTRDFDAAEDAVQEAFAEAARAWRSSGVPDDPTAWLTTVARRKALDGLRRERTLARKLPLLIVPEGDVTEQYDPFRDERLRLIFTCCHPATCRCCSPRVIRPRRATGRTWWPARVSWEVSWPS